MSEAASSFPRREVLRLALRGISRNRRRTLTAGAMIAIGVIAIVFARGFIVGLQVIMMSSIIDTRSGAFEVAREGYHASAELAPLELDLPAEGTLHERLAAVPGVEAIAGRIRFFGMIHKGEASQVFTGRGLDRRAEARVCPLGPATRRSKVEPSGERYFLIEGEGLGREDGVVLAHGLAESLGAHVGDRVTLVAQTQSGSIDAVDATVTGLYRGEDPEENRRMVIAPLALTMRLLHMSGRVSTIGVRARDQAELPRVERALRAALAQEHAALELSTWGDLDHYLRDVMILQDRVLGVVMVVLFVLMLTGVANTMLMSVFERTREIGTFMCLGVRRRQILGLFLIEALALATLAALVGAVLGIGLVVWANHTGIPYDLPGVGRITNNPRVDGSYVALGLVVALVSSLTAAIYPAWRASRLRPVEALRIC